MTRYILVAAAVPALIGSLLLLNLAATPTSLLIQQAVVASAAMAATLASLRFRQTMFTTKAVPCVLLVLAALLWLPVLTGVTSAPQRWVGLCGFRLYVAPVVLPVFLLLWDRARSNGTSAARVSTVAAAVAAIGLLAQPDAAQLTALAVAAVSILGVSALGPFGKLLALVAFLGAVAAAWSLPDPLDPVPYVEGVFRLAMTTSGGAWLAAVVAAALPVAALAWVAREMKSPGILAVALYFAVLYLLSPLQVTPVPLLGFGAGPVLGYFIVVSQIIRDRPPFFLPDHRQSRFAARPLNLPRGGPP